MELRIYLQTDNITEKQMDELDAFLIKMFDTEDIVITTGDNNEYRSNNR